METQRSTGILDSVMQFLQKKDDKFPLRYKNLTITVFALILVAAVTVTLAKSCSGRSESMQLNPDDTSDNEVLFEDNNAVAVTPEYTDPDNSLTVHRDQSETAAADETGQTVPQTDSSTAPFDNQAVAVDDDSIPVDSINTEDQTAAQTAPSALEATLYCGTFKDRSKADESKASIAFATGIRAEVINLKGAFTLKIGPFDSRYRADLILFLQSTMRRRRKMISQSKYQV